MEKINVKIWKVHNSNVITIPKYLMKTKLKDKKYIDIIISE